MLCSKYKRLTILNENFSISITFSPIEIQLFELEDFGVNIVIGSGWNLTILQIQTQYTNAVDDSGYNDTLLGDESMMFDLHCESVVGEIETNQIVSR